MSTLTNADKTIMKREYFRLGHGKEEFKGVNPSMNGVELLAVLQAIEDAWQDNKATVKTAMDVAANTTLTNAQAKVIGRAWLQWKAREGNL